MEGLVVIDQILNRIADVALRDQIKRQLEIQNETISNLESLQESQKRKIEQLQEDLEAEKKRKKCQELPQELRLFESDNVFWSIEEKNGVRVFKAYCPQCQDVMNRVADFWDCRSCGFEDIGARPKPSKIPDWAT